MGSRTFVKLLEALVELVWYGELKCGDVAGSYIGQVEQGLLEFSGLGLGRWHPKTSLFIKTVHPCLKC